MKARILFISFFTISLFEYSYSQGAFKPSYIVKNQVDTIFGTGNVSKDQEYCLFKRVGADEYSTLYPEDIDAFRIIDGKYYVSRQIQETNRKLKWYFLEYLVDGKIDLFVIANTGRYFVQKDNEALLELRDNVSNLTEIDGKEYMKKDYKYIGYLTAYMSETPELFPKINKLYELNQRNLVNIVTDYHNVVCKEYECLDYTKNMPKITYKIEVFSGINRHNNYYTPQYGVLLHIWRPLRNERLYLNVGILYSDRPYYRKIEYINEPSRVEKRSFSIKFPISFQYVFGERAFKPTIAIGLPTGIASSIQGGFIYSISDKFDLSFSGSIDGLIFLIVGGQKDIFNNQLAHTINLGLIYRIK